MTSVSFPLNFRRMKMKRVNFAKMGTKKLHLKGTKKKGSMTTAEHQIKRQKAVKDNPLW